MSVSLKMREFKNAWKIFVSDINIDKDMVCVQFLWESYSVWC